jgi:hypothetical protein
LVPFSLNENSNIRGSMLLMDSWSGRSGIGFELGASHLLSTRAALLQSTQARAPNLTALFFRLISMFPAAVAKQNRLKDKILCDRTNLQ